MIRLPEALCHDTNCKTLKKCCVWYVHYNMHIMHISQICMCIYIYIPYIRRPLATARERVREGTSAHGVEGSSMVLLCGGARSGPGDGAPDSGIEAFLSRSESGRKGLLEAA